VYKLQLFYIYVPNFEHFLFLIFAVLLNCKDNEFRYSLSLFAIVIRSLAYVISQKLAYFESSPDDVRVYVIPTAVCL